MNKYKLNILLMFLIFVVLQIWLCISLTYEYPLNSSLSLMEMFTINFINLFLVIGNFCVIHLTYKQLKKNK